MQLATRRRSLAFILCAVMLLGIVPVQAAEAFPFIGYTTDSLRLRQQASSTSTVLLTVPKGAALEITGADGSYYIATYEGRLGYALSSFITRTAPEVAEVPSSAVSIPADVAAKYPQLATSDEGPLVRVLQEALKELNFYKGTLDGKYGTGTAAAVAAFQKRNALTETGIADPLTQQKLFEKSVKNAAGRTVSVRTLPLVEGQVLRPGDRGEPVRAMQQLLKDRGFYTGTVDGIYGRGTENAVRAFQKDRGLKVDGKAGANTLAALSAPAGAQTTAAPEQVQLPEVTPSPLFTEASEAPATYPYETTASAAVNMRKRASQSAQRMLTIPAGATIQVLETSGDFLKVTYRNYTGYAMSDYINVPEQYLSGKALPFDTAARQNYEALAVGASGDKVRSLQRALEELGFFTGKLDGVYGAATISAVKAFQEKNKLRATGTALPELQQLIYEKRPRNAAGRLVYLKLLPPIPGYPMEQGDVGDAVLNLHRSLQQLGHYTDTVNDIYTAKTANAVKAFQKAHSIRQTGKVDNFTTLAINTAMGVNLTPPDPVTTPLLTEDNVIVVRSGTRGLAVTQLQTRLVALGYYAITPDGIYDGNDIAAVKEFQKANGLLVNGIADLATQRAMYADTAVGLGATAAPAVPTLAPQMQTLKIGDIGDAVKAMQSRLITLKYLTGTADGIFGTQTAQAVTAFQQRSSLRADGIAGNQTLTALYAANAASGQTTMNPSAEEDAPTTLRAGDTGASVRAMQQRLVELKYLLGGADGVFGPKTFLALQAFQQNNKLTADGIAGSLTLARLADVKAVGASGMSAPQPSPAPAPAPTSFTAPRPAEVRFANWEGEIRSRARSMPNIIIYDFMSDAHYNVKLFSVGAHADGEPVTAQDTATMERKLGYNNWEPRPVWIIFSDGRVYMGSTHSHGHEVDHNARNNLTGHICVHFPRELEAAQKVGPYAVSHQNAILAGWDLTQGMAR